MSAPTRTASRPPPAGERQLRAGRRIWLAVALVTGLVVALATGADLLHKVLQQSYSASTVYRQPITALSVRTDSGSVTVRPGPVGEVTIQQRLDWIGERPAVQVDPDGGTLKVTVQCDGGGSVLGLGCVADLIILVPPQLPLTSTGPSGDLTVQRLGGPLNIQTGSGDVDLDNVTGSVQVVGGSGDVNGVGLRSAEFQARTGSGPVNVVFALPPRQVGVVTSSGPVDLRLPRGSGYRVGGSSDSGPRSVNQSLVDDSATDGITVDTDSGPVDIGY